MPLSSLPFLNFSEELPEVVRRELEQYTAKLRNFLLVSLNEDGSLRTSLNNSGDLPLSSGGSQTFVNQENNLSVGGDTDEQWWKKGPWTLDDPNTELDNVVALRPPAPPAGTYNDYAPPGIDSAVALELAPTGNITLNGIQKATITRKRMLMLRNSHATSTITLKHANTGSKLGNRFSLPAATDVLLDPGQNIWLYYDLLAAAWTAAITTQKAGGFNVGGASAGGDFSGPASSVAGNFVSFADTTGKLGADSGFSAASLAASFATQVSAEVSWTNTDIVAATSKQMVAAAGAGKIIIPLFLVTATKFDNPAGGYLTTRDLQVKYASGSSINLITANSAIQNTATIQYTWSLATTLASLGTNRESNVAVNAVPSGTNTFLGVPPSHYQLIARLVYIVSDVPLAADA